MLEQFHSGNDRVHKTVWLVARYVNHQLRGPGVLNFVSIAKQRDAGFLEFRDSVNFDEFQNCRPFSFVNGVGTSKHYNQTNTFQSAQIVFLASVSGLPQSRGRRKRE